MGSVSAKERDHLSTGVRDQAAREGGVQVSLDWIPANVVKVHVEGVARTSEELILCNVRQIFKVKQFQELVLTAQDIRNRLQSLGCFSDVAIHVDTAKDGGPSNYEVTFSVQELKRIIGSVNTLVGNQEGCVMIGGKMPNLLGRGERFQMDYSYGNKRTSNVNVSLSKPIHSLGCKESSLPNTYSVPTFTTSSFQHSAEFPPSGYKELLRGFQMDFSFLSAPQVAHNLQWEGIWRELGCVNRATAFAVREQCGHSLKSSLKHILTVDRRDNPIFPSEGSFFRLSQEFAGLGGDVGFFKNELETQANLPLWTSVDPSTGESFADIVLQGTFNCGILKRLIPSDGSKVVTIADNFFLGGPLNVRGFEMRGLGPSSENNALGGHMYWATGLHLYTPLPFRSHRGGFGELFRTHFFLTGGNVLSGFGSSRDLAGNFEAAIHNLRLSYGIGVALKLGGIARVELNYCIPIRAQRGDRPAPGLQFGIGVNFL